MTEQAWGESLSSVLNFMSLSHRPDTQGRCQASTSLRVLEEGTIDLQMDVQPLSQGLSDTHPQPQHSPRSWRGLSEGLWPDRYCQSV